MDHVLTGFPELDDLLEAGLTSPSCVCVSGQFHLSQRNFVLQLVNNFLERGHKGIYICLDRPAAEVRNQFKRIGLDIGAYDGTYKLFFIDFFTYSQNALIESSTLRGLEYTPRLLLDTISPFLDWIKNGFIIVDTLSTLTLNMDTKEAYEFMRGIKLLGRAFNLITIGVTHIPVAEMEPVVSNSDGNLQFKESVLFVNRFENVNDKMLLIMTHEDGKITLRTPQAQLTDEKDKVPLLEALSKSKTLKTIPTIDLAATQEVGCSIEELSQKLKPLEEQNAVTKTPSHSTVYCSQCSSQALELYLQCPECQNRLLDKGDIVEHFKCGNVGFEANFKREGKLVCQKCNTELKQLGVDYRRVGVGYRCANKHLFSIPKLVFVCTQCREQFNLNEAKLQTQYNYELTEKGKRQAIQAGYHPE